MPNLKSNSKNSKINDIKTNNDNNEPIYWGYSNYGGFKIKYIF